MLSPSRTSQKGSKTVLGLLFIAFADLEINEYETMGSSEIVLRLSRSDNVVSFKFADAEDRA
jgi:hypothetical protein